MKLSPRWTLFALIAVSGGALAGPTATVPEPGTFELLALGGVLAVVLGFRSRRRK